MNYPEKIKQLKHEKRIMRQKLQEKQRTIENLQKQLKRTGEK